MLQESAGTVLRAGDEVATRKSLDREREMVERINRGLGRLERLGGKSDFIASDRLQILNLLLSTYEVAIQRNKESNQGSHA